MAGITEFVCDRCSHCCRKHRVPITFTDLKRLQGSASLPEQDLNAWTEFLSSSEVDIENEPESLALLREGRRLLVLRHKNDACIFLDERRGCIVHAERPSACRAYPFDRPTSPNDAEHAPQNILGLHPEFICPPETQAEKLKGADETNSCAAEFLEAIRSRDSESSLHAALLQDWNAEQRSRLRLRRLPLAGSKLLQRLTAQDAPSDPP